MSVFPSVNRMATCNLLIGNGDSVPRSQRYSSPLSG